MSTTLEVRLSFGPKLKRRVTAFLEEADVRTFVEAQSGDKEVITFYCTARGELGRVLAHLDAGLSLLSPKPPLGIAVREIPDEDWQTAWQKHWTPVEVSPRLCVAAPWSEYEAKPGQTVLRIKPGMAFGSGTHPTTRLCLLLLERELSKPGGRSVLDFGCGTGILSIAARKLGATEVTGVDVDEEAVTLAKENAAANGEGDISFSTKTLAELGGRFDIVCANILSGVILLAWPGLKDKAAGSMILSGIVEDEAEGFFRKLNCAVLERHELDGWVAALV